jgi:nitrogen fixation protein FixH
MVLACLVTFFGIVFAMNFLLVRVALSSFGGVETESSYKAGLTFTNDVAAAHAQDARHWAVDAAIQKDPDGTRVILTARDAQSRPLTGLAPIARLSHPTDRRRDVTIELNEVRAGRFQGLATVPGGQWDLVIELIRDGDTVFRSKSRVIF